MELWPLLIWNSWSPWLCVKFIFKNYDIWIWCWFLDFISFPFHSNEFSLYICSDCSYTHRVLFNELDMNDLGFSFSTIVFITWFMQEVGRQYVWYIDTNCLVCELKGLLCRSCTLYWLFKYCQLRTLAEIDEWLMW